MAAYFEIVHISAISFYVVSVQAPCMKIPFYLGIACHNGNSAIIPAPL